MLALACGASKKPLRENSNAYRTNIFGLLLSSLERNKTMCEKTLSASWCCHREENPYEI
jgi:hypothetical protein